MGGPEPKEPAGTTDGYESTYMDGGGGEILLRDRTVWRWGIPLLGVPALAALAGAGVLFAGLDPSASAAFGLIPLVTAGILGSCALLLTVLRVVVSTREVHIQYGPFGPRIPIESIAEAKVIDYDWKRYGGWGVRIGLDGSRAYSIMSKAGRRAVEIRWMDGGSAQTTVVTSEQAEAIVAAIAEARSAAASRTPAGATQGVRSTGSPAVRVEVAAATGPESDDQETVELEREAARGARSGIQRKPGS